MFAPTRIQFCVVSSAALLCALSTTAVAQSSAQNAGGLRSGVTSQAKPASLRTIGLNSAEKRVGAKLEFQVRVEGAAEFASLRLINPQPGMVFEPVLRGQLPFDRAVRWQIPEGAGERVDLHFELDRVPIGGAVAGVSAPPQTLIVPIQISRDSGPMVRVGDVTGDGLPDVVAVARHANHGGVVNSGVGFVWLGKTTPSGTPDATLEIQSPTAGDQLGDAASPGLQLFDLNGDGILDIVLAAESADVNGVVNAGAVFAYLGGPGLAGSQSPDVTFRQPAPAVNDKFGSMPVLFADLTGDTVPELICGSSYADVGGVTAAGGVWVWSLGAGLGSDPEPGPLRELTNPTASAGDRLGFTSGQSVQLIDLNSDTILDVVVGAQLADVAGIVNLGEL